MERLAEMKPSKRPERRGLLRFAGDILHVLIYTYPDEVSAISDLEYLKSHCADNMKIFYLKPEITREIKPGKEDLAKVRREEYVAMEHEIYNKFDTCVEEFCQRNECLFNENIALSMKQNLFEWAGEDVYVKSPPSISIHVLEGTAAFKILKAVGHL